MTDSRLLMWKFIPLILDLCKDGELHRHKDLLAAVERPSEEYYPDAVALVHESGTNRARNAGAWAIQYSYNFGFLERSSKGMYRITAAGVDYLTQHPFPPTQEDTDNLVTWGRAKRKKAGVTSSEATQVWVVRAGREGERESFSRDNDVITPGLDNVPDLADLRDYALILEGVLKQNPEYSKPTAQNFAAQANALRNRIKPGDHILLPLKSEEGLILEGICSGEYFYREDEADTEKRHALPVTWNGVIAREDLLPDLIASINGAQTVFEVKRNGALERLESVLDGELDPGDPDETTAVNIAELYAPAPQEWSQFHEQLADELRPYAEDREALLGKLHEVAEKSERPQLFRYLFQWKDKGKDVQGTDIDPFTIFGVMNRGITVDARIAARRGFKEVFNIDASVPEDFAGIPVLNNMRSRFETAGDTPESGFYDQMWDLFIAALDYSADPVTNRDRFIEAFDAATHSRRPWMFTIGLYWVRPRTFLNLDSVNRRFLTSSEVILPEGITPTAPPDGRAYLELIAAVKEWLEESPIQPPTLPTLSMVAFRYANMEESTEPVEPPAESPNDQAESTSTDEPTQEKRYSTTSIIEDGAFFLKSDLDDMLASLREKKNLILQGPPGTGKTWLARRLAKALTGDESTIMALQFHPSTSYEDFIQGWRPSTEGPMKLVDGPFLEAIRTAEIQDDAQHVVIIDEINRGNPAQVFGEMLTLLEADKRSPENAISLLYSDNPADPVFVPGNFYVIGTMNLSDRSLAMVDMAFRRRFAFYDLEPQFNDKWIEHCVHRGRDPHVMQEIQRRVEDVNKTIEEYATLGDQFVIGHSFLTPAKTFTDQSAEATWNWFQKIVRTELRPLLQEYWLDDQPTLVETLARLTADYKPTTSNTGNPAEQS